MADKYIKISNGQLTEQEAKASSSGASDAGKIAALNNLGKVDDTMLPSGIGADVIIVPASENLSAGDFVNIWNDGGTARARKADATTSGKRAFGFVLIGVTAGNDANVLTAGHNDQLSGLVFGSSIFLSEITPGAATETPPSTSGNLVQFLGTAASASIVAYAHTQGVVLA